MTQPPSPLWYLQYHNIFSMIRELGIPWPFTDFETSGFWGANGTLITQVGGAEWQQAPACTGSPCCRRCRDAPVVCTAARDVHVFSIELSSACEIKCKSVWSQMQAPVFSKLPRLPAVLGQFVHTFNLFE